MGIYTPGPKVLNFKFEVGSGFRVRNVELKGSGVFGSEGDNSPFQVCTPNSTSYSDSWYPKPHCPHFLVHTSIFVWIYRTEPVFEIL